MTRWLTGFMSLVFVLPAYADTIDLYIISGQSNAFESPVQEADDVAPELLQIDFGVRYSMYDMFYGNVSDWIKLRPREVNSPAPGLAIGPEMSFGLALDRASDNPIAVIKAWRGGADLDEDFDPDATDGLMAYRDMMDYVQTQIGVLRTQGHTVHINGFAWVQGESDAAASTPVAGRYGSNLEGLIDAVRNDLDTPDLPFVYNRLNINADYPNTDGVRAGQQWVSAHVPHTVMLNVDQLPLSPDMHHYGVQSKVVLGEMLADAFLFGPAQEDFNGDGLVNADDLNVLVANWDSAVPAGGNTLGDADGDGFVGWADLTRVVNRIPPLPPVLRFSDFDGDDYVGIDDLNMLLTRWNTEVPPGELGSPDTNSDGYIGLADLSRLLAQWNTARTEPEPYVPTEADMDLDGSGLIDREDLEWLLSAWSYIDAAGHAAPGGGGGDSPPSGDFNADGVVDIEDLRYLIAELPVGLRVAPADLDGDGFVGVDDLGRVLSNWNQSVPAGAPLLGDVNGDGFVGIDDLNLVLGSWNTGTPPAPGTSVPDPASATLILGAGFGLVAGRRRRPA